MRLALIPFLVCVAPGIAGAGDPSVALADMTSWTIVCSRGATECEQYAATEFQALFKGMIGKVLPIAEKTPDNKGALFIGPQAVAISGEPLPTDKLGEEGLRIHVGENAVCIHGGRPRGTLYGVYEFFEALCGVRYLTRDHTYYPNTTASLRIPCGEQTYEPLFAFRWSYYGETSRSPEFAARLRTNTVSDDPKL
ncbi:MAG: alpha-glucuronidase family glycosyl hydrolase, partial [Pirellulales bacterium]